MKLNPGKCHLILSRNDIEAISVILHFTAQTILPSKALKAKSY